MKASLATAIRIAAALSLLLGCGWAHSATWVVTTTADPGGGTCGTTCALRDAINAAAPNDSIAFAIPATDPGCASANVCTIALDPSTGAIFITKNVTLDGSGQNITLDGTKRTVLLINLGATLQVNALTFVNSYCELNACVGAYGGGAITNVQGGQVTVTNSVFSNNSVGYSAPTQGRPPREPFTGSAIYSGDSTVSPYASTLIIANSTFTNNYAPGGGGAVYSVGRLTITNSTFSGNTTISNTNPSSGSGGAVLYQGGLGASITGSTFSGNSAVTGGAVWHVSTPSDLLTITNSTFAGNSAVNYGGAVDSLNALTVITNSTLSNNVSAAQGGAVSNNMGSLTLNNTILANNGSSGSCAVTAPGSVTFGPITDGGGNLSDDASCGFPQSTSLNGINPDLGPLQYNGGPTQTLALLSGSPAIPLGVAANCPATDQRGVSRPGSGQNCSSGAFQYVAPLTLACPAATARVGVAYSSALAASGGVLPYHFSITKGSLPPGLTSNATTGGVSGTPSKNGSFEFMAQVKDSNALGARTVTVTCEVTVSPPLIQLTETPTLVNFGSVVLNSQRVSTVIVGNTGTAAVSISSIAVVPSSNPLSAREFVASSSCPPSLPVGTSCSVNVTFFALSMGSQSATLLITSNAQGSPQAIPLTAFVVP